MILAPGRADLTLSTHLGLQWKVCIEREVTMFALFPEILHAAEKGDPEALALLVRKYFGESQTYAPRLRVVDLFRSAGIEVKLEAIPASARLEAWDSKGRFFVQCRLNPKLTNPREQNFALAHMLGHVFFDLHPKMANGELQRSIFDEAISPAQRFAAPSGKVAKDEALCDAFAVALLLPRGMVKKAFGTLASMQDTAAFFAVDAGVLEKRLEQLGMRETAPLSSQAKEKEKEKAKAKTKAEAKAKAEPPSLPQGASQSAKKPQATDQSKDQSSMTRVARNVAALSYRREEQRKDAVETPKEESGNKGLDRLRQIAKKIDKSVDV